MKQADLEKQKAKKIVGQMQHVPTPERFAQGAGAPLERRAQRRRDQESGLVAFAVKLDHELVTQLQVLAVERKLPVNQVVDELLRKALAASPAAD